MLLARSMAAKRVGEKRSGLGESDDGNEDGVQSGDKLSGQRRADCCRGRTEGHKKLIAASGAGAGSGY